MKFRALKACVEIPWPAVVKALLGFSLSEPANFLQDPTSSTGITDCFTNL